MPNQSTAMTHTLKIDLVSDVVCPWCAIGYKRLQQAIELLDGEIDVEIEWHAFLLNPDVPPEGTPILEHLMHKYGKSEAEIRANQQMIVETAQELGLDFSHATDRRSWNTFNVHRVLAWAKEHGKYTGFKLALFDAYFGQAKNPTDPALLKQIAGSLDLDREQVDVILGSDRYAEEVERELAYYRSAGVSSVPSFVVENQYLLAGAQDPQTLANAFREIASNTAVAG
ncbi:DsbA family oxidoreductase [Salinisphaera aquimarina]|uniref:DsbA family oxidoreductase n=1 Tax=Salinisphaera aquimarina TaxID=2094031 RepID=A0ABV7EK35_9GAMM